MNSESISSDTNSLSEDDFENIKLDFLYLGSEPNLKQNTLNRYGKLYNKNLFM